MLGLSRPNSRRLPCWPIYGCTRAEMYRRGFASAVLNRLLLERLAIAHVNTEVRGSISIQTRLTITPAGLQEIGRGDGDR